MRRLIATVGLAGLSATLLLTASVTAHAAGTASAASGPPRASLRAFACRPALDPASRSVSVTAVMRPLPGTRHMALRFDLLSQFSGGSPTVIHASDLGQWVAPANPTLGQLPGDVWYLQKPVVSLGAPASYRFRVQFRWTGKGGRALGSAVRLSPRCRQRELRPNLQVRSITVTPIPQRPHQELYSAVIANTGNSAAGPFAVLFAPADGTAAVSRLLARLRAHSSRTISFVGPLCTAATDPTITADSALQVHELNRADNSLIATCPVAASG